MVETNNSSVIKGVCPRITVGIMDFQHEVSGSLNGVFYAEGSGALSGGFNARTDSNVIILKCENNAETIRGRQINLIAQNDSTFSLENVTIGKMFHWERQQKQTFQGNLILMLRADGTIAVINEISLEDYLESVISSEMNSLAPFEFLKAHAITSRSWLISALKRKGKPKSEYAQTESLKDMADGVVIRWYEQEEHDIYDVCADDHCQRYQGRTKISSENARDAVKKTSGVVITHNGDVCDARYYKACGGITEEFNTAWEDRQVPYLTSVSDAQTVYRPVKTEEDAAAWIMAEPEAYCNTKDRKLLRTILPDFDLETEGFFRWKIEYKREELENIIREKTGYDIGILKDIIPIRRGPSGRISVLRIVGSRLEVSVGKELEIRRWLSRSHLYSSAFIVTIRRDASGMAQDFTFYGAGWGHGVGLCQIGAANMAARGFKAEEILRHYFKDTKIMKIY